MVKPEAAEALYYERDYEAAFSGIQGLLVPGNKVTARCYRCVRAVYLCEETKCAVCVCVCV